MFKPCVIIPVFDHERAICAVVDGVLGQKIPCILVDDGSGSACGSVLDELARRAPDRITLLRHSHNRGKGGAVLTGVRHAAECGYSHAVQIDADGQHRVADIPRFLSVAVARPQALIVGCPQYGDDAPFVRLWARHLTHLWVTINTLSRMIRDSMCGFRVYPLAAIMALDRAQNLSARMSFDVEVLVRLHWAGCEIINLSTAVSYPSDGVSHFRAWLDTFLLSRLHATLFFGMLVRSPMLIARKWSRQSAHQ